VGSEFFWLFCLAGLQNSFLNLCTQILCVAGAYAGVGGGGGQGGYAPGYGSGPAGQAAGQGALGAVNQHQVAILAI